jgi:phytoene synthase
MELITTYLKETMMSSHISITTSWEQALLAKATLALENYFPMHSRPINRTDALAQAYAYCEHITRENSRTFYIATALMPREKRQAIRALYAFCRVSDDMVDKAEGDALSQLAAWRAYVFDHAAATQDPVLMAWQDTCQRYRIPHLYVEQLLDGLIQDVTMNRYPTFDDLAHYCYGVASTVGLMSMHIIGYSGPQALPYAIKLGIALQLTNILRDVGEDWRRGRLYLPQDELAAYSIGEEDIAHNRIDRRWRTFMQFQIARAHRLYEESLPGIGLLYAGGRFAVAAAAELYRSILDDITAHDYNVFTRRAHVSDIGKLIRLPGIWWRAKTNQYAQALR